MVEHDSYALALRHCIKECLGALSREDWVTCLKWDHTVADAVVEQTDGSDILRVISETCKATPDGMSEEDYLRLLAGRELQVRLLYGFAAIEVRDTHRLYAAITDIVRLSIEMIDDPAMLDGLFRCGIGLHRENPTEAARVCLMAARHFYAAGKLDVARSWIEQLPTDAGPFAEACSSWRALLSVQ